MFISLIKSCLVHKHVVSYDRAVMQHLPWEVIESRGGGRQSVGGGAGDVPDLLLLLATTTTPIASAR
jgi:hypothetical protein